MQHCPYSTDCTGCVTFKENLLQVKNVNLSYDGRPILRDVNVSIQNVERRCHVQGQVIGFLGPSGIGKTQLARIIAGLNKPDSGEVLINSTADPVKAGMVGVVSQGYTLFEHRTVWGNLMIAAGAKSTSKTQNGERAMGFVEQFGMADKIHLYPAQLSGGQRQRIAIIQQLLCSDHFLLMDEPTASLDLVKKEELAKIIDKVACMDDLNTVIIVSHDIEWLASVSDHLWLLGCDRDADGNRIPGARIQENYNLVDLGLCWQDQIVTRPDFVEFIRTVKERFRTL